MRPRSCDEVSVAARSCPSKEPGEPNSREEEQHVRDDVDRRCGEGDRRVSEEDNHAQPPPVLVLWVTKRRQEQVADQRSHIGHRKQKEPSAFMFSTSLPNAGSTCRYDDPKNPNAKPSPTMPKAMGVDIM